MCYFFKIDIICINTTNKLCDWATNYQKINFPSLYDNTNILLYRMITIYINYHNNIFLTLLSGSVITCICDGKCTIKTNTTKKGETLWSA